MRSGSLVGVIPRAVRVRNRSHHGVREYLMRVLWLSPWRCRPICADTRREPSASLGARGDARHVGPSSSNRISARPYGTGLLGRPDATADGWLPALDAYRPCETSFQPDLVVTRVAARPEVAARLCSALAPRVRMVHDDKPHDERHVARHGGDRLSFDRWDAGADATVVFSNYVADSLRAAGAAGARPYVSAAHR